MGVTEILLAKNQIFVSCQVSSHSCVFLSGEATWGGEKTQQAEHDEYDGSEFMGGGGGGHAPQCKQM
jgi:hypothetical protein